MSALPRRRPRLLIPFDPPVSPEEDVSLFEAQQRRAATEVAGDARCPRCRTLLVARMGCRGPYFHCHCVESMDPGYHAEK